LLLIVVLVNDDENTHSLGDQNKHHAAEQPQQSEKLGKILKIKMVVKDVLMQPVKVQNQAYR
jgi:hypothetical protein